VNRIESPTVRVFVSINPNARYAGDSITSLSGPCASLFKQVPASRPRPEAGKVEAALASLVESLTDFAQSLRSLQLVDCL
jgi:hypothetical protein